MSNAGVKMEKTRLARWLIAIVAIAIWFVLVTNSAKGQEIQVPAFVLAQVLGSAPESTTPTNIKPARATTPTREAAVTHVAHRMQQEFQDQLIAGVPRPHIELEVHFGWDSAEIEAKSVSAQRGAKLDRRELERTGR